MNRYTVHRLWPWFPVPLRVALHAAVDYTNGRLAAARPGGLAKIDPQGEFTWEG